MEKLRTKSKFMVQTIALLILLCLSVIAFQFNSEVNAEPVSSVGVQNTSFSIIQITDTQHLADMYPQLFDNLTKWIASNVVTYNVSMVIHTGDIVDYANSLANWQNANRSISTLLNNGVPYLWTAGNHDQFPQENPNASWLGNNFAAFNPAVMRSKPYWVSDLFNGKETAVQFSYGNYKFLIIDMEYFANSSAISWMNKLITTHSDYNIIVGVHCLLNSSGGYNNNGGSGVWENNFVNTLNQYPNVFLTLNGHDHGLAFASRNQVGNRTQIFWDMQEVTNSTGARVGAASARIYSFNMNSKMVTASTYLVYNSTWLNDSKNSFVFGPVSLQSVADPSPTPLPTSESTPTPLPSLEPTPIDTLNSNDPTTENLSPISIPTQSSSFTNNPIPTFTPSPTTKPYQPTPSPFPTTQPQSTPIVNASSSLIPDSPSSNPKAINNGAYLPFSELLLTASPYISTILFISVCAVIAIKKNRK